MLIAILLVLLVIVILCLVLVLTTRMVLVVNGPSKPVPISGTTTVAGPVIVGNAPANPVLVRSTDRPALQPFSHRFLLGFNGGENQDEAKQVFTVPAGKRLVLEDVFVGANLGLGQRLAINLIKIELGGEHTRHGIAAFPQVARPGGSDTEFLAGGRPIRIYLEPGDKLTATAARNSTDEGAFIDMFVYGYFVDLL